MSDQVVASLARVSATEFARPPERETTADKNRPAAERSGSGPPARVEPIHRDRVKLVTDEESGRSYVQILDKKTGDVMYQIPPEEVHKLSELLKEMTGSVVDTVA